MLDQKKIAQYIFLPLFIAMVSGSVGIIIAFSTVTSTHVSAVAIPFMIVSQVAAGFTIYHLIHLVRLVLTQRIEDVTHMFTNRGRKDVTND